MKAYLLAVVLISLTVLVDCQRPRPPKPKRCSDSDSCEQDECCVGFSFWGGKCKKLVKEGERCLHELKFNGMHMLQCPCQDGLECVAEKINRLPWGRVIYIRPRCITPNATTTVEEATTLADIRSEEVSTSAESSEEVATSAESSEEVATSAESSEEVATSAESSEESKEE